MHKSTYAPLQRHPALSLRFSEKHKKEKNGKNGKNRSIAQAVTVYKTVKHSPALTLSNYKKYNNK
jgi:hypothetical protein